MSNRFEKLYSLSGQLYAPSSPVIITAGALLKDTQTGKVLAQLKFKNINSKVIKAVTVSLLPLDTANQPLGEKETHQILDLTANRDDEFGQKTPLYFSNNTTRAYQVVVEEVVFSDNTVWKTDGAPLSDLPTQKTAADMFSDDELEKQYKLECGERATYIADTCSDLWRCNCGAVNRGDETNCHACGAAEDTVLSFDLERLKITCQARLEQEQQKNTIIQKERRKRVVILTIFVVLLLSLLPFLDPIMSNIAAQKYADKYIAHLQGSGFTGNQVEDNQGIQVLHSERCFFSSAQKCNVESFTEILDGYRKGEKTDKTRSFHYELEFSCFGRKTTIVLKGENSDSTIAITKIENNKIVEIVIDGVKMERYY